MHHSIASRIFHRLRNSTSFKASSIYMFGLALDYGLRFISLRIFTNLLRPSELGEVAIFASWFSMFNTILTLNVQTSILNAKKDFSTDELPDFLSSITTLGLISSIIGSAIILILPEFIYEHLFGLDRSLIGFALLASTFNFGITITAQVWRVFNRASVYTLQSILNSTYSTIFSVMLIGISFGLTVLNATEATVIGTHITTIGIGGYLLIRRLSIGRTYINLKYWRYATILSIPLIGHLLSSLILSRADQILIQSIIGSAETGIYSLAYRVGELPNLVLTSIGSVWSVWFFDRMANRDNKVIRKYSTLYVLGIAVTIIGVMIVGPFFYRIITPPIYWEGIPLIPVVATGFIWFVMYSVIGLVEQFEKKNTYRAVATLVAAIFNITANIILLPIFGYQIAAWTTVASYAVMFVLHVLVILFVLKKRDLLNLPVFFVIDNITTIIAYGFYNVY